LRIPAFAIDALKRWVDLRDSDKQKAGKAWQNQLGVFFCTNLGGPLNGSTLNHEYQKILQKCGLPQKTFYDLRHGTGSYMARAGHHETEIQAQLGHTDPRMTRRYTHALNDSKDRAAASLQAMLGRDDSKQAGDD
jgi:integrase